jgi:hypothetical protein
MAVQTKYTKAVATGDIRPLMSLALPSLPNTYNKYSKNYSSTADQQQLINSIRNSVINPMYLSNTKNTLAYNSLADIMFNRAAQEKRWGGTWLDPNKPWAFLTNPIRVAADTGLMAKNTTIDPIIGSIQLANSNKADEYSIWDAIKQGTATAGMNALINVGNTLDIIANPVKGLIIEGVTPGGLTGFEGFWKGLYGDKQGRKQYDYSDYIDNGIASLALEIVSDPMNLISFGTAGAAKAGLSTAAEAGTKTLVKETAEELGKAGLKSVTKEIAEEGVEGATKTVTKWVLDNGDDAVEFVAKKFDIDSDMAADFIKGITKDGVYHADTAAKYADNAYKLERSGLKKFYKHSEKLDDKAVSNIVDSVRGIRSPTMTAMEGTADGLYALRNIVANALPQTAAAVPKNIRTLRHLSNIDNMFTKYALYASSVASPIAIPVIGAGAGILHALNKAGIKRATNVPNSFFDDVNKVKYAGDTVIEEVDEVGNIIKKTDAGVYNVIDSDIYKMYDNSKVAFYDAAKKNDWDTAQTIIDNFKAELDTYIKGTGYNSVEDFIHAKQYTRELRDFTSNLEEYLKYANTKIDTAYKASFKQARAIRAMTTKQLIDKGLIANIATQGDNFARDIQRFIKYETGTEFFDEGIEDITDWYYRFVNSTGFEDLLKSADYDKLKIIDDTADDIIDNGVIADDAFTKNSPFDAATMSDRMDDLYTQAETFKAIQDKLKQVPLEDITSGEVDLNTFLKEFQQGYHQVVDKVDTGSPITKNKILLTELINSYGDWYASMSKLNDTLATAQKAHLEEFSKKFDEYFKALPDSINTKYVASENLADYVAGAYVEYGIMASRSHVLKTILEQPSMQALIKDYGNVQSGFNKVLNSAEYVGKAETEAVKHTFDKASAYVSLTDALRKELSVYLTESLGFSKDNANIFIDSFIDSLHVSLEKPNAFLPANINKTMEEILSKTDMNINTKVGTDTATMDYFLKQFNIASDGAHNADVDTTNWFTLAYRSDGPFAKEFRQKTKGRYKIGIDLETTSELKHSAEIYQISIKVYNTNDKLVGEKLYKIATPDGRVPAKNFLDKVGLTQDEWLSTYNKAADNNELWDLDVALNDIGENFISKSYTNKKGFSPILCGHNIRDFDLDVLKQRGGKIYQKYFEPLVKTNSVFDSYADVYKRFFKLTKQQDMEIKHILQNILSESKYNVFTDKTHYEKVWNYFDIQNISAFKQLIGEQSDIGGALENVIRDVKNVWSSSGSGLGEQVIRISTKTEEGINIMRLLNRGVYHQDGITMNVRRIRDTSFTNYFDVDSIIKEYSGFTSKKNGVPQKVISELTKRTRRISSERTRITGSVANVLYDDAIAVLKVMQENPQSFPYIKHIPDTLLNDKISTVALVRSYIPEFNTYMRTNKIITTSFETVTPEISLKSLLTPRTYNMDYVDEQLALTNKISRLQSDYRIAKQRLGQDVSNEMLDELADEILDLRFKLNQLNKTYGKPSIGPKPLLSETTRVRTNVTTKDITDSFTDSFNKINNLDQAYANIAAEREAKAVKAYADNNLKYTAENAERIKIKADRYVEKYLPKELSDGNDILKNTEEDVERVLRNRLEDENVYTAYQFARNEATKPCKQLVEDVAEFINDGASDADKAFILSGADRALTNAQEELYLKNVDMFIKHSPYTGGMMAVGAPNRIAALNKIHNFINDSRFHYTINEITETVGEETVTKYVARVFLSQEEYLNAVKNISDDVIDFYKQGARIVHSKGVSKEALDLMTRARSMPSAVVKDIGYSTGEVYTENMARIIDQDIPGSIKNKFVNTDFLIEQGYFKTLHANNAIIGDYITHSHFNSYYASNAFTRTQNVFTNNIVPLYKDQALYINLLLNTDNGIKSSDLFAGLKDEQIFKLLKDKNSNVAIVSIRPPRGGLEKTKSGVVVEVLHPTSANDIKRLRDVNAHIIPSEFVPEIMKAVNDFELPKWAAGLQQISKGYKLGYLSSIGWPIRNAIDSYTKNFIENSVDGVVPLGKDVNGLLSANKILYNYKTIMTHSGEVIKTTDQYKVLYDMCTMSSDEFSAKYLKQLTKESFEMSSADRRLLQFNKKQQALAQKFFDLGASEKALLKKSILDPEMFELTHQFIINGPSAGLTKQIADYFYASSKLDDVPKLMLDDTGEVVVRTIDKPDKALDQVFNFITEKLPGTKHIFSANELIEQSARFNLYLTQLRNGEGISGAVRKVIDTHFDYSDKSLLMLYVETIFPFMSFSFKNLTYWADRLLNVPKLARIASDCLKTIMDYNSLFEEDYEAFNNFDYSYDQQEWGKISQPWQLVNAARLYHLLQGNIVWDTGKDVMHDSGYGKRMTDLYSVFKLNPSMLDAYTLLTRPLDSFEQRMLPPVKILWNTVSDTLSNGGDLGTAIQKQSLLNNLPVVGAFTQRIGLQHISSQHIGGRWKHNSVLQRTEDAGLYQALSSVFGAFYVTQKDRVPIYGAEFDYLTKLPQSAYSNSPYYRAGGFTPNYYATRMYGDPYLSNNPTYRIHKLARNTKPRDLYSRSKRHKTLNSYSDLFRNQLTYNQLKYRTIDKYYYL